VGRGGNADLESGLGMDEAESAGHGERDGEDEEEGLHGKLRIVN